MAVAFEVEGSPWVLSDADAAVLAGALRRAGGEEVGLGSAEVAAILIEHELVEQSGKPLHLTADEGKAVLAAIETSTEWADPQGPQELREALRRRRRLELGLE